MGKQGLAILLAAMTLLAAACNNPSAPADTDDPIAPADTIDPIASTIVFADGETVSRVLGSGNYTNATSGTGDGTITFSSGTPSVATVNAETGAVSPLSAGTTVITASKSATSTHTAVTAAYTLTITGSVTITEQPISLLDVPGIIPPETGETPVIDAIDTAQYSGTFTWSPANSGTFLVDTVYTATITLVPKSGYSFFALIQNSFKVRGATVTHDHNSGVLTAVFPSTSKIPVITVPAGRFQRDAGSDNVSEISRSFKMTRTEITRAQFMEVMGVDPADIAYGGLNDCPVQNLTWYHAIAFCNKLSLAEGRTPVYTIFTNDGQIDWNALTYDQIPTSSNPSWNTLIMLTGSNGYRLPTQMEWMWAAMGAPADGQNGGTNSTGYAKLFAGDNGANAVGDYAVYGWSLMTEVGRTTTQSAKPAGTKLANELGLLDMSGNVAEWCWDWYGTIPDGIFIDYKGPDSGTERVLHGGSWHSLSTDVTIHQRAKQLPQNIDYRVGLRVVRR